MCICMCVCVCHVACVNIYKFYASKMKNKKFKKLKQRSSIKVLEDNTGENLGDLGYVDEFLDITPKTWAMKERIGKLDFIKILINALWKEENVMKIKRLATDCKKILEKTNLIKDYYPKYIKNT